MPLSKKCPDCGALTNVRRSHCSCGYFFVTKHSRTIKSASRKQAMSAFGVLDTEEKVFERRLLNKACKAGKRATIDTLF